MAADIVDRTAFAERLRVQLSARYAGVGLAVEAGTFAIRLTAPGLGVSLPLAPVHNDCLRHPERTPALIAAWVAAVEKQLTPGTPAAFAPAGLLWCVRTRAYMQSMARRDDLALHDVAGDLVAFVAETLPGSIMRGVPRDEWQEQGVTEAELRRMAGDNTSRRFAKVIQRLRTGETVPRDGWRLGGDALFQGSLLMVPELLSAFASRAGGEVVLAVPDRSLVFAIPHVAELMRAFRHRVNQAYREALSPCSRELLITDGAALVPFAPAKPTRRGGDVMEWLRDH